MKSFARILLYLLCFIFPFSIAGIEILFPFLFITWLIGWHVGRDKPDSLWRSPLVRPLLFSLLMYLAVCVWSIPFSSYPVISATGMVGKTLEYAFFLLIVSDIANHPHAARRSLNAVLTAACLVILYAFLQEQTVKHFIGPGVALDPIRGKPLFYDRMVGPYANPNDLATFLMVVALVVAAQLFSGPILPQISLWVLGVALMICLGWTESKGAILGFTAGLVLLLSTQGRSKKMWLKLAVALLITGLFFIFKEKDLLKSLTLSDPASKERAVMWNTAWRMIQARPWLGHGVNTFMANYQSYSIGPTEGPAYAHNCLLQVTAETGLIGLACFLWFLWQLFSLYWRSLRNVTSAEGTSFKPLLAGLTAGLLGFLIQSVFDTNFYSLRQATLFWSFSGLAVGLCAQISHQASRRQKIRDETPLPLTPTREAVG